ncbi:hypothetical protein [Flavobacterium sp.]|uniref:hypothetical protein n=1 Tax=Flavobacterium sp. TaxID=239 RepID=UPI0040477CA4
MNFKIVYTLILFQLSSYCTAQSTLNTIIKGGELLVTGISIFKTTKNDAITKTSNNSLIATICVKNKLNEKILVKLSGKDDADNEIKKEMVVQNDGKECVFEIPKGIYTYEIILSNKEIFQKGEYKFEDEITITVKKE